MGTVGIVARIVAGLVLVFAGTAKMRTRAWALLAMESGTPRSVVVALPVVEILLGVALAIQLFTAWLPWLSVALYGAFTVFVIQRVASGSRAGCNCFGVTKSQEPVNSLTIVRNVLLCLVALAGTLR